MTSPDPGGLSPLLSDLLLFAPSSQLPESLEATLPTALSAPVVRRDQRLGLYWEMYQRPDSSQAMEIAVTPVEPGRRGEGPYPVGRPSCPFAIKSPVKLRWVEDQTTRPEGVARAVALDLRSLSPRRYLVTVQLGVAGGPRGCSSREIQVTARRH